MVQTGISDVDFVLVFHSSPLQTCETSPQWFPKNSILEDTTEEEACGLAKTFPDAPDVSQMLGGSSVCRWRYE